MSEPITNLERCACVAIDVAQVPNSAWARLNKAFTDAAKQAFTDPDVQAEYEAWLNAAKLKQ